MKPNRSLFFFFFSLAYIPLTPSLIIEFLFFFSVRVLTCKEEFLSMEIILFKSTSLQHLNYRVLSVLWVVLVITSTLSRILHQELFIVSSLFHIFYKIKAKDQTVHETSSTFIGFTILRFKNFLQILRTVFWLSWCIYTSFFYL